MDNNKCFIAKLGDIKRIEGADKIVSASVILNGIPVTQVVVGIDIKEETPIVYFDSNMCLSDVILKDYPDMAKYLAKYGRVKVIKLKSVISNGLIIELDKFLKYFPNEKEMKKVMKEGYAFTHIKDIEICHKYTPPLARHTGDGQYRHKGKREPNRMIEGIFKFHFDTAQLLRNMGRIIPDSIISVSRKVHGTSAICGNVMVKRKLSIMDKILKLFGVKINKIEYDYIYASRNTVKNARHMKPELLNKTDLWIMAGQKFTGKLYKDETIYYEIVGYMPTGRMIQKGYDYGCNVNEFKIVVYRITMTNVDGISHEYSWLAMKDRCFELGVSMVEEYYYGKAKDIFEFIAGDYIPSEQNVEDYKSMLIKSQNKENDVDIENANVDDIVIPTVSDEEIRHRLFNRAWGINFIEKLKIAYLEKDCEDSKLPKKMPDEGIVIRVEGLDIKSYKLKSEKFLLQESKSREEGVEDIEESEAVNTEGETI